MENIQKVADEFGLITFASWWAEYGSAYEKLGVSKGIVGAIWTAALDVQEHNMNKLNPSRLTFLKEDETDV